MMGLIHVFVAVLSILSVGQSAPVTGCESLIQPIEIHGGDQMLGKWMILGEATDIPSSKLLTKKFVENAWVKVTAANESDAIDVHQVQKMFGSCFSLKTKVTLENNTLSMGLPFNSSARLLTTGCPDCLVYRSHYNIGEGKYNGVQLMSRRTKVSAAELEEFKKQVECLNLPPPAILNQDTGLCLDDSMTTDLTTSLTEFSPKLLSLFERLMSSAGGLEMLLNSFSSQFIGLDDN